MHEFLIHLLDGVDGIFDLVELEESVGVLATLVFLDIDTVYLAETYEERVEFLLELVLGDARREVGDEELGTALVFAGLEMILFHSLIYCLY
jgi:hypothetical protein